MYFYSNLTIVRSLVLFLFEGERKHKFFCHFEGVAVWQILRTPSIGNEFVTYMRG